MRNRCSFDNSEPEFSKSLSINRFAVLDLGLKRQAMKKTIFAIEQSLLEGKYPKTLLQI